MIRTAQARVLDMMGQLCARRGGLRAHTLFVELCADHGLPEDVADLTIAQCVEALRLMECAAYVCRIDWAQPFDTGWRDFLPSRANVQSPTDRYAARYYENLSRVHREHPFLSLT